MAKEEFKNLRERRKFLRAIEELELENKRSVSKGERKHLHENKEGFIKAMEEKRKRDKKDRRLQGGR